MKLSFAVESGRLHIGQRAFGRSARIARGISEMAVAAASYMREEIDGKDNSHHRGNFWFRSGLC